MERLDVVDRGAPSGAELQAAVGHDVEGRGALRDAHGVVAGQHDDGVAQPDPASALGERAEEDFRRRGVADLLVEVVLGQPEGVEAHLLGAQRLLEGLPVDPIVHVDALGPGLRRLHLGHQSELHPRPSITAE